MSAVHKDLRPLIEVARKQGWRVDHTKSGHLRWIPPEAENEIVYTSSTPSDVFAIKKITRDLERSGLRIGGF